MIAGTEEFDGERREGHNIDESFYAQHQLEALNMNNTVLDEMKLCGSQKTDMELRALLGCFLFSGDDVEKKVKVLSGGEKARVALAKTIVSKANFLLLDEPTNHLDMHSCDLLIEALNKYEGSFILVSHDRYFIAKTANKIWEIDNLQIKEFKGGYEEWVQWKERMAKQAVQASPPPAEKKKEVSSNPQPPAAKSIGKETKKELQKQQRIFQQLEEQIAALQQKKKESEQALLLPDVYSDSRKFAQTESAYKKLSQELHELNERYEKVFEQILELEKG